MAFFFGALPSIVSGHGALVTPRSRNSIDYLVGINVPKDWPTDGDCTNITGQGCFNGQAPFWYSQGCFIGCPECDHLSGRVQADICGMGFLPTLDPEYRTVNLDEAPGSPKDIYKHNPWRAPGTAPVGDACGLAGGTPWLPEVSEAGDYTRTIFAHHGMNGTKLPPMETGVVWKLGGVAEVTAQIENNHGGGYSYRLCPSDEPLTEACFQRHPLDFDVSQQGIVFRGGGSHSWLPINGTFVDQGTYPKGSMWARLPLPTDKLGPRCIAGPNDTSATPNACEPWEKELVNGPCKPCPGTPGSDCSRCDNNWHSSKTSFPPPCDGCSGSTHFRAIRDVIRIPLALKPGKYVLSWRWDCEATAQVWSSCADVTLVP